MVEIPSVALLAEKFAREVDFFSIGSNDLVQYTLAVDRTNSKVAHLYQPANPAVIKLISQVVNVANQYNVKVSLCGEMAGDSKYTLLLLGLGLRELSMNAVLIPTVKQIIRNISCQEAEKLIRPVLSMDTSEEIETSLEKLNKKLGIL
jgi:phosphotransferase system enzyme I (PtsI)